MMPRGPDSSVDRKVASPARAVLLGRDHTAVASIAVRGTGRCAVGLARGWEPKPYPYVDPNEDAVAVVEGADAQLLVVADGHHGHEASHAAVRVVLDLLGSPPRPADLRLGDVRDVARRVAEHVWALPSDERRPRTTLVVALRTPRHLQWFAAGDSALLVVTPADALQLTTRSRWFLGDDPTLAETRRGVRHGRIGVPAEAAVVAVTDGYTDYLPGTLPPAPTAATAVRDAKDAQRAAAALLEQAHAGGAGDNVGVSLSLPW
jgi:serine/threonine protein phosphatase PrpC